MDNPDIDPNLLGRFLKNNYKDRIKIRLKRDSLILRQTDNPSGTTPIEIFCVGSLFKIRGFDEGPDSSKLYGLAEIYDCIDRWLK